MVLKYEIHKNFLSEEFFKKIKNHITTPDFPWRRRDSALNSFMVAADKERPIYFTYCFYNSMISQSEFYEPWMIPILNQLHAVAPIQVRANMFISALFKKSSWHADYNFKCKTAILYLNDCDGGTELKIDNKVTFIKADANKILVFDTLIQHRAITSKKEPIRYIINFNYFTV